MVFPISIPYSGSIMVYFFGKDSTTFHKTEKNSNFNIKFLYNQTPTTLTILCHTSETSKPADCRISNIKYK